ncbi:MAG: sigma-70 family RNA polymerase sigma factor [Planctomycetota bacterium]
MSVRLLRSEPTLPQLQAVTTHGSDPGEDPATEAAELEAWTRLAASGDREALEALLERMLPDLRAFVRLRAGQLIRRHENHSDVVQSVCREVLTHADRFQFATEGAFRRWLFTTTLRKLSNRRDHLLAEKRDALRNESSGKNSDEQLMGAYARIASPSQHAAVREDLRRVEAAMQALSEEERSLIVASRIMGLSRKELAEEFQTTEGAIRMRLHRALARLTGLMDDEPES